MRGDRAPSTFTVQQLIDELLMVPEDQRDMPVLFACDYGDYHHTTQTLGINTLSEEPEPIRQEAYSQSGWGMMSEKEKERLAEEEAEDDDPEILPDEEEGPKAFILS